VGVNRVWLVFLLIAGFPALYGQEDSLVGPDDLRLADAVVVGTLHHEFVFPWFDGWNERGYIVADQVLRGGVKAGSKLPFAWERDFNPGWCAWRPDWRGAIGKRGIWLLKRDGSRYRSPYLFGGFHQMKDLAKILAFLRLAN
jgi:hypothetical protein